MSEMIERVARAMYAAGAKEVPRDYPGWDREPEFMKSAFLRNARAAIEAMREPTAGMKREGFRHLGLYGLQVAWDAMFDQALKPHVGFPDEP